MPRRSLLFMPGDDRRKIEKGIAIKPDCVIMDMEDGVAVSRKVEARHSIVAALKELDFGSVERVVRVNALDTGLTEDELAALAATPPDAVLVPKIETPEQVTWARDRIPQGTDLLIMIETARAIVNLKEIASAPGLSALVFGAEDLIASVGGVRTQSNHEVHFARSSMAIHAAAFGLKALDQVYVNFSDDDGLRAESRAALEMGYSGKTAIHPRQIIPINETFTPGPDEVSKAETVVRAFREHQANGSGAFAFEGKMVDMPVVRAAEAVLARAGVKL